MPIVSEATGDMPFHRNILRNFTSLGLLQLINYLVPVIIIPILLQRIGLEQYGLVILAQGIMNIFISITDFGMNMTGTRLLTGNYDPVEKRKITFQILTVKITLGALSFFALWGLTTIIPSWNDSQLLILSSFILVIANIFLPTWYFQGVQKMKWLPILHLISRLLYMVSILVFIHEESDYLLVNVFNGISATLMAFVGLAIVLRSLNYRLTLCSISEIWSFARSNVMIFLSVSTGTVYRNSSIIIAGFFLNGYLLGIYGVVDKIVILIANSYSMLFRAIYPTLCQIIKERTVKVQQFIVTTFGRLFLVLLPFMIVFFLFGTEIFQMLSAEINVDEVQPLILFLTAIPFALFLNLPISLLIVSFDMKKEFFFLTGSALVVLLLTSPFLVQLYMIKGLIFGLLCAEITMMITGIYFLNRRFALLARVEFNKASK